jgi:hypothetical protein
LAKQTASLREAA